MSIRQATQGFLEFGDRWNEFHTFIERDCEKWYNKANRDGEMRQCIRSEELTRGRASNAGQMHSSFWALSSGKELPNVWQEFKKMIGGLKKC